MAWISIITGEWVYETIGSPGAWETHYVCEQKLPVGAMVASPLQMKAEINCPFLKKNNFSETPSCISGAPWRLEQRRSRCPERKAEGF